VTPHAVEQGIVLRWATGCDLDNGRPSPEACSFLATGSREWRSGMEVLRLPPASLFGVILCLVIQIQ
jgi:hypothetical protein